MPSRSRLVAAAIAGLTLGCGEPPTAVPIRSLPRPLTAAETQLVASTNDFTFSLLGEVLRREPAASNVFISPLSFSMALGMTLNGAAGATESSMQHTLALDGLTRDEINRSYRGLIDLLRGLDPQVTLTIANSIWHRQDFAFAPEFLETNRTWFDAEVRPLDFGAPGAPGIINGWVNTATGGRIPEIVPSPLPFDAIMYLINAIYFKADWAARFDQARTRDRSFHLADGTDVQAPTMTHGGPTGVRSYQDAEAAVLDLPYGGGAFSMTIVVPRPGLQLDSLTGRLTRTRWDGWIGGLDSGEALVYLPRFTVRFDIDSATEVLRSLGMYPAFCDDVPPPDFTRLYPAGGACMSAVKHKTFVLVDEAGTEAAAATSVEIGLVSVPPSFVVDRPFLFAIRERFSGTVLFIGRIMDPTATP